MTARRRPNVAVAALLAAVVSTIVGCVAGCGASGNERAREYMPDMARGPAYKAFAPNPALRTGLTLQAPVPGTIARGQRDRQFHYGKGEEEAARAGRELTNPLPISADGICAAIASTGTRERWQSKRPLMRCRLPGPQLPAQTASSPVRCASAPAAKAPTSSCRIWIHSILPWRRIASVRPFRLSPTIP